MKLHVGLPRRIRHPFHRLCSDDDGEEYRCDGCFLDGAGARYECRHSAACDIDLHVACALAPPAREIGGISFVLMHEPPEPTNGRFCDACGAAALGFVFHCSELDHDLHPTCAESLILAGLNFELCREKDMPGGHCVYCDDDIRCRCRHGHGRDAWYYRCDGGEAALHVACAKELSSKGFRNMQIEDACDKALAYAATGSTGGVFTVSNSNGNENLTVSTQALRQLLLKRQGGGALRRSLRVFYFVVRVVLGLVFGDPTSMTTAVAQVVFSDRD